VIGKIILVEIALDEVEALREESAVLHVFSSLDSVPDDTEEANGGMLVNRLNQIHEIMDNN
jgi:hypothetical protein